MSIEAEDAAGELGEWADSVAMHIGDDVREARIRDMAALVRALEQVRVAAAGIHIKTDRDGKPVIIGMLPLSEALAAVDRIREGK